jgi:EAL domain-containing protein (putative c-di-GMP-specific phosphodiesterase class I)
MSVATSIPIGCTDYPSLPKPRHSRHGPFLLSPNPRDEAAQRRRMQRDLHRATEAEAFVLRFEPVLSLRHGKIRGAEALLFWPHPRQGLLPAATFLPEAPPAPQAVEQAIRIGNWHLSQSCREAASEPFPWPIDWTVSVRVSCRQLGDGALLGQIALALEHTGLAPERLDIRMGEAALSAIDVDTLLTLSALRDLGVGLTLDDFGTGCASLSFLKRLPLTAMKLDRTLIRDLPADREDAAILRAIITTGHALGMEIVADGIDTESQRAFLAASGCDSGQGLLFAQPLTSLQLAAWPAIGPP